MKKEQQLIEEFRLLEPLKQDMALGYLEDLLSQQLSEMLFMLNGEGKRKVVDYADTLIKTRKYAVKQEGGESA